MLRQASRITTAAALAAAFFAPAAFAQTPPPALQRVTPEMDKIFTRFMADNHVPGLVYGVVAHGKLEYVKPFGVQDLDAKRPVTADSLFRIA
ncbi:MAG: serine hydrolase, partial [Alphaproteobacteria bacterium]|nr:serine hydrolase [Alphaproteobacteria bacterium]